MKIHSWMINGLVILTMNMELLMPLTVTASNTASLSFTTSRIQGRSALNSQVVRIDLSQLKRQSFSLINHERSDHGALPLKHSRKLDRLAAVRARQVEHHFSHYDHHGNTMTYDDAAKVGLPRRFSASENIASAGLGRCMSLGDPKIYHNHNGNDMANMANDAMMNHDQLEQNGHRKNILSHSNTLVGVGVAYNAHQHKFYLAEDFGSHDPMSSEDVDHTSTATRNQAAEHWLLKRTWHQACHAVINGIKKVRSWL